jgi:hypothetical protein
LIEERAALRDLPRERLESFRPMKALVNSGSLIQVLGNTYSVHSRLLGEHVNVRVYADQLEIWYAQRCVDRFPRLRGRGKHQVNYRHIIDWLVRKPGAFANYRYREDLFPTSYFRMAYDALRDRRSKNAATRDYLEILRLAAYESEAAVNEILRRLLTRDAGSETLTIDKVRAELNAHQTGEAYSPVAAVQIDAVNLAAFDLLLDNASHYLPDKEVFDDYDRCETNTDGPFTGTASTFVS